jgi:hypothetical protein
MEEVLIRICCKLFYLYILHYLMFRFFIMRFIGELVPCALRLYFNPTPSPCALASAECLNRQVCTPCC